MAPTPYPPQGMAPTPYPPQGMAPTPYPPPQQVASMSAPGAAQPMRRGTKLALGGLVVVLGGAVAAAAVVTSRADEKEAGDESAAVSAPDAGVAAGGFGAVASLGAVAVTEERCRKAVEKATEGMLSELSAEARRELAGEAWFKTLGDTLTTGCVDQNDPELVACYDGAKSMDDVTRCWPESLQRMCSKGEQKSCGFVAETYLREGREDEGVRLAQESCSAGVPMGCYVMGLAHRFGRGVAWDVRAAYPYFERSCGGKTRVPAGCVRLAEAKTRGWGTITDSAGARELLEEMCTSTNKIGCADLGIKESNGYGGPKDLRSAMTHQLESCEDGNPYGCYRAGNLYEEAEMNAEAGPLRQQAYEGFKDKKDRDPNMYAPMAMLAFNGVGKVKIDAAAYVGMLETGCARHGEEACYLLANVRMIQGRPNDAVEVLRPVCRAGMDLACVGIECIKPAKPLSKTELGDCRDAGFLDRDTYKKRLKKAR
jgi:hypothetical protein